MTNSWTDMKNTRLVMVLGSNFVENHPGCVQQINDAIERTTNPAKVVVVDPRKTRTASWAEQRGVGTSVKTRPGTDIAFIMGLINYAIVNDKCDWVYLYNFSDAAFLMASNPLDNNANCDYSRPVPGGYNSSPNQVPAADKFNVANCKAAIQTANTVFSYLTTRASHYTAERVSQITGMATADFNNIAAIITDPANRPGSILYAMGGTQHSYASQQLHSYCMLQVILGNMGRNGGGVNALRGIHNVQGSTDMGLLKGLIPGYSAPPATGQTYVDYMDSLFGDASGSGLQQLGFRNMLHAWFRQADTPIAAVSGASGAASGVGGYDRDNPTATTNANYAFIPKGSSDDHITMFQRMKSGAIKGLFCLGQNPAVTEPNLNEIRAGLAALDVLVVADVYMSETATCHRTSGRTILLPACSHTEESGSVTSSARWIAWRYMAAAPKGESKNDLWILMKFARALAGAGAFDHIPVAGGFPDTAAGRYDMLYGSQYHAGSGATGGDPSTGPPDFGTLHGTNNPNGIPKYVADVVAENVNKQICAGMASAPWGALWIYAGAYDQTFASGALRYGVKLAAPASKGDNTITVDVAANAGTRAVTIGQKAYLGNFGGTGVWWDESVSPAAMHANNSKAGATAGSTYEEVTIQDVSVDGLTITLAADLENDHATGEPFTQHGFWSVDASDGMLSKSRSFYDPFDTNLMPRFAFAWLVNRRIFYNNNPCHAALQPRSTGTTPRGGATANRYAPGYITACLTCPNGPNGAGSEKNSCMAPGDSQDVVVAPDKKARLFVHHNSDPTPRMSTGVYRAYNKLGEYDYPGALSGGIQNGWTETSSFYGNFRTRYPKHWEPWEAPVVSTENGTSTAAKDYGRTGALPKQVDGSGNPLVGSPTEYPLVLTTWRICWHFQGGPMTRNVPWLAELDPDPVIEINSSDAYPKGIETGDQVLVHTVRGNDVGPFIARVGIGAEPEQNTKRGVVGIPWHWGRQMMGHTEYAALSEGAPANEACIDASDGNTWIPESKACLCRITKV